MCFWHKAFKQAAVHCAFTVLFAGNYWYFRIELWLLGNNIFLFLCLDKKHVKN
jgi:hypothetical protein